jgi:peptidoglycan/LPS O-acetylase OafA/YrhL
MLLRSPIGDLLQQGVSVGVYRYVLACCVVVGHVAGNIPNLTHSGMFAVFGFYVLSGYLITRVLNDVYGFAFMPFWANRFLRLWPPYLVLLLVGTAIVFGTKSAAEFFPEAWKSRPHLSDWIGLLTVFPMGVSPMTWSFRPVPSIWSVGVELLNYALLYVAVARGKHIALLVAMAAAAFHVDSIWRGEPMGDRYFPFYAAALPFALGALIYFYVGPLRMCISPHRALLTCAPVTANLILAGMLGGVSDTPLFNTLFYLNLAFQCMAVIGLSLMAPVPFPRLDKLAGDWSYPVFLSHWIVAFLLMLLLVPDRSRGVGLMFATLAGSSCVAYFICHFQDTMVEPLRRHIRADAMTDRQRATAVAPIAAP